MAKKSFYKQIIPLISTITNIQSNCYVGSGFFQSISVLLQDSSSDLQSADSRCPDVVDLVRELFSNPDYENNPHSFVAQIVSLGKKFATDIEPELPRLEVQVTELQNELKSDEKFEFREEIIHLREGIERIKTRQNELNQELQKLTQIKIDLEAVMPNFDTAAIQSRIAEIISELNEIVPLLKREESNLADQRVSNSESIREKRGQIEKDYKNIDALKKRLFHSKASLAYLHVLRDSVKDYPILFNKINSGNYKNKNGDPILTLAKFDVQDRRKFDLHDSNYGIKQISYR